MKLSSLDTKVKIYSESVFSATTGSSILIVDIRRVYYNFTYIIRETLVSSCSVSHAFNIMITESPLKNNLLINLSLETLLV